MNDDFDFDHPNHSQGSGQVEGLRSPRGIDEPAEAMETRGEPRARYWLGTYFPTGLFGVRHEPSPTWDPEKLLYLRGNPETCPESGRFHWQLCIVTRVRMRRSQLQRCLNIGEAHLEVARSPEAVKEYCSKDETKDSSVEAIEHGEFPPGPTRGKRTDLSRTVDSLRNGLRISEIAQSFPETYVRNYRGLERLRGFYQATRGDKPTVEIHWGITGSGKTRQVYDRFDRDEIFAKDPDSLWWDGYDGQECILIDDYYGPGPHGAGLTYASLLRICDRYPFRGQYKGGFVDIAATTTHIIFTSNQDPNLWFGQWHDNSAFFRRVDKIVHYEIPLNAPQF